MDQVSFSADQFAALQAPTSAAAAMLSPVEGVQLWVFGVLVTLKVTTDDTGGAFAMQEDLIPPKHPGPHPHYHTREDEFWYMTEGELTWIVEGKEHNATKGSVIHVQRNVLHSFENRSEEYARMLVMYTPGGYQEWFRKVGKPAHGASMGSPAPAATKENYRMALHYMEIFGLGFAPPSEHAHHEDARDGEFEPLSLDRSMSTDYYL